VLLGAFAPVSKQRRQTLQSQQAITWSWTQIKQPAPTRADQVDGTTVLLFVVLAIADVLIAAPIAAITARFSSGTWNIFEV